MISLLESRVPYSEQQPAAIESYFDSTQYLQFGLYFTVHVTILLL
jgi:hypothetical protein